MKKQLQGTFSLLACTMIWGSAFIAQSVGMDLLGPFTFQAIRCVLAVTFLFGAGTLIDRAKGKTFSQSFMLWKNRHLWKSGLICGSILFVGTSLQQIGLVYTDAGKAGFITAMYIVMVPIIGLLFKQKPPLTALLSVGLAVAGLYLLSCMGVSAINIGDLCILGGAAAFALHILIVDRRAGDVDSLRFNGVQAVIIALLSLPFLGGETILPENILSCWFPLFFAGVCSMGIGYTLQVIGQKYVEPVAASLVLSLESVFAALGGWLILHETMNLREIYGCALVFLAVIISQIPVGSFRFNHQKEAVQ